MELVFIRHGEREHTLDIPSSLNFTRLITSYTFINYPEKQ